MHRSLTPICAIAAVALVATGAGAQTAGTPTTPEETAAQLGRVPRCVIPHGLNLSGLLSRVKQPTRQDLAAASMRHAHELFPKVGCKEGYTK